MRFYIVGLIAFLLSANAHAEAGTAVYAIYTWFATYGVYVAAAVAVTATVYGSANARKQAREAAQRAKDDANASLQDRRVTVVSDSMPHRFVYGKARVGSVVVAQFTSGDKDQFKHLVCVHAAHECDGFEDFWVAGHSLGELTELGNPEAGSRYAQSNTLAYYQDFTGSSVTLTLTPDSGSVYVIRQSQYWAGGDSYSANKLSKLPDQYVTVSGNTVTVTGSWGPLRVMYQHTEEISGVSVRVHLGGATDPVDSYLNGLFPTAWPSTSVLRGYCYSVVTLNLNNPEFQSGIPTIEILLRGRKDIYDPRTLATGYSTNTALCLNNYLQKYCDIPESSIPESHVIAAANVCDEIITVNTLGGLTETGPRYTCNGSDTTDTDPTVVIDQMATAMCGGIDATTFEMFAGSYTAPLGSLVAEDVIGTVSLTPALSDADLSNGYKGQAALAENDYVNEDYVPYQNATYVTADGTETWNALTLPWTNNTQRVHNICRILTEDARNAFTVKAVFSLKALQYKIGQRVNFTFPLFMFADKVFRVTDKTYTASGGVELTLKEDTAEIWDEADAVVVDATPNSNAPDPWLVDPVAGLAATSGTATLEKLADGTVRPRLLVSWTNVGRDDVTIELQIEDISTGIKTLQYAASNETQTYVSNVSEFSMYAIRICAVNNFSQARSPYRWLISEVIGKSQPPSPVAGASVTVVTGGAKIAWQLPADVDWSETEWRYGTSFDAGTRIYRGTATECVWLSPAQGTYQLWGVNYDTSGIRSTTPTQLTLVFGASGLVSWNSIDGKPTEYRITARGAADTSSPNPAGLYNISESGMETVGGRSYHLRVWNATGGQEWSKTYDVFGSGAAGGANAADLAIDLNFFATSMPGLPFALFTQDEPRNNRLNSNLAEAVYKNGGSRGIFESASFKYRSSYCLVGLTGCGEGNATEKYNGAFDSDTHAFCEIYFSVSKQGKLTVHSDSTSTLPGGVSTELLAANAATDVFEFASSGSGSPFAQFAVTAGDIVVIHIMVEVTSYTADGETFLSLSDGGSGNPVPMTTSGTAPYIKAGRNAYVWMVWGVATLTGNYFCSTSSGVPAGSTSPLYNNWRIRVERLKR